MSVPLILFISDKTNIEYEFTPAWLLKNVKFPDVSPINLFIFIVLSYILEFIIYDYVFSEETKALGENPPF